MSYRPDLPMIVQSDRTILLEAQHPQFEEARQALAAFAELMKSPEYIHTYRMTPLSLWNAAAAGTAPEKVTGVLERYSKYGVPPTIIREIHDTMSRYGLLRLEKREEQLLLCGDDPTLLQDLTSYKAVSALLEETADHTAYPVKPYARGLIKQELIRLGYPVQDFAGYNEGEACPVSLRSASTSSGAPFSLRAYQQEAVDAFYAAGTALGGSGVLVLPCGAGKTVIGLGALCQFQKATLILTTNTTSVRQWISELLEKTDLDPSMIGEYSGERKEVKPVTVATYQILTYRPDAESDFPHMALFSKRDWGLIIYDEVHLLPAPVFRVTSGIQATRRLGLTATLVREDGREEDVFTLIGPKKYEMPWKSLEEQGWIAEASCREIRLPFAAQWREAYAQAGARQKYRIAAENPLKLTAVQKLLSQHEQDQVLIIGQYVEQLETMARQLDIPVITGKVPERERELLYQRFKKGELKRLIVSKVANFAVDLPDANVAIQISGTYGSRQEEAQRLGRILRPKQKENAAHFYTLVTRDTREQEFAMNRQLFLIEQGYKYEIVEIESLD
ncbi:helicase-associated domain-containing protein [Brevibacillus ruminantium]|uniref:DNA 3'-5' helicase n=1 Tax=Brevibacillus ruminantium TaxID=2950604 RepID=A0ABY4WJN7_9BACL|nr:DNA repair helicase XPB [Brevibacillus ruminantium]USG67297.1 helicase-associated domain-containing protein [Brevibacillus ruminantium]